MNPDEEEKYEEKLKKYCNIDIQSIQVTWFEYPQKLAALVMSGDSPDMLLARWGLFDYPSYIVNDLVQPINEYTDLNHPLYSKIKEYMDILTWKDNKNYIMVAGVNNAVCVTYNKQAFENAGLDNPWELYKKNEWDWTKMAELAEELYFDENNDGTPEVWGLVAVPSYLTFTTGIPFGEFKDGKFVNNSLHPDIVRCMSYLYDLFVIKKIATYEASPATLLKGGKTAMLLADFEQATSSELNELKKEGKIGIVPYPRDPEKNMYYTWGYVPSYFIPKGAKNPKAAIAYWNYALYLRYFSEYFTDEEKQKADELQAKQYESWCFDDELILQYEEALNVNKEQIHEVKPVIDMAAWIGFNSTINNCIFGGKSWTKAVEEDRPIIETWIKKYINGLK
jgi:multiple sugar transport system substrate-binding protein